MFANMSAAENDVDMGTGDAPAPKVAKPASKGGKQAIEKTYQKKSQLEHILLRPDTYIGSVEKVTEQMWVSISKNFDWRSWSNAYLHSSLCNKCIIESVSQILKIIQNIQIHTLQEDVHAKMHCSNCLKDNLKELYYLVLLGTNSLCLKFRRWTCLSCYGTRLHWLFLQHIYLQTPVLRIVGYIACHQ